MNRWRTTCLAVSALMLAACAAPPTGRAPAPGAGAVRPAPGAPGGASAQASAARRGGYYLDDGPGGSPPVDLASIPDALPRLEPLHRWANRPYVVFDRQYVPMTRLEPFRERGVGSWYGRKFHGQRTASGEVYDMYAMTAAHPTLPIPSYVRVTHTRSGRSVVVRVNDRGPFLHGRVIDLSWTAAAKLGYAQGGSGEVDVELVIDPTGFAEALPAGVRAGAAATPPLALLAIADTPPRIVPTAPGTTVPAAAAATAPGAPGATVPGTVAPGASGAQAPRALEAAPAERLDVETVIAPQPAPPRPPPPVPAASSSPNPSSSPSNVGVGVGAGSRAGPASGSAGPAAAGPPAVGAAPTGAAPSGASAPASSTLAAPARAGVAPGAVAPPGPVLYLQIGAFAQRENALAARSRTAAVLGLPLERIQLRSGEGALVKVLAGPYAQRADALAAAEKLRLSTDLRPVPALLPR